jgi:hypothetical protein
MIAISKWFRRILSPRYSNSILKRNSCEFIENRFCVCDIWNSEVVNQKENIIDCQHQLRMIAQLKVFFSQSWKTKILYYINDINKHTLNCSLVIETWTICMIFIFVIRNNKYLYLPRLNEMKWNEIKWN